MTIDAQALAGRALDALQANGASGDVFIERRTNLSLRVREGALEGITRAEIRGVAVRAMKNGRLGFVHTADATDSGVSTAAERAAALSNAASTRDDLLLAPAGGPVMEATRARISASSTRPWTIDPWRRRRPGS